MARTAGLRVAAAMAAWLGVVAATAMSAPAFAWEMERPAEDSEYPVEHRLDRVLDDPRITESSGLARGTYDPEVLWTHNDGADPEPRLFAIAPDGGTREVLHLKGVHEVDFEDIAAGPGHQLWVGDIGDDHARRPSVQVYAVLEPTEPTEPTEENAASVLTTRYDLVYADGPHDAEALLVHPLTGRLLLVTSEGEHAGIYVAPQALSPSEGNVLRRVADAPSWITAGAFTPAGDRLVLSDGSHAYVWDGPGRAPVVLDTPDLPRGQSLEISEDGRWVLLGSEGRESPIYRVALPAPAPEGEQAPEAPPEFAAPDLPAPPGPPDTAGAGVPTDLPGWRLDLVEEFDTLDGRVWNVRDRAANSNEDSYLLETNAWVEDGVLRIQARNEAAGGRRFTSGYVDTNDKYRLPDYFRAEVRARVPMEQGLWAAPLWLRPADFSGGEIDLVETYGSEAGRPTIHQTIHTDYGNGHRMSPRPSSFLRVGDLSGAEWHTYTVEKVPGRITMWVDGIPSASWGSGDPAWFDAYYEAGKEWVLRVNLQVGGDFGGLPDATTDWTPAASAMLVDHVYTWVSDPRATAP